ncbi:MAG: class I SAM-dependent methyltransferase [Pseudomonadota bacterium]
MANANRFWDRHAPGYAKRPVADQDAYETKLEVTRKYLKPNSRVLEVGCGTGTTAIAHAPYAGEIIATDLSAGMLEIARQKATAAAVSNVEFRQSTVEQLDEATGSFDMVMAHSVLHLLEDKDAALRLLHKLLKPGGVLVSSTMCLGDGYGWLKWVASIGRSVGLLPLIRVFTPDELRKSMIQAGFVIEHDWRPAPKAALFLVARKETEGIAGGKP